MRKADMKFALTRIGTLFLLLAVMNGCATTGMPAREPTLRVPLANGVSRNFYVQSLFDMQTRAVDVDAQGNVVRDVKALTYDNVMTVQTGMDADEVLKRIGPPFQRVTMERQHNVAWDYRYRDSWGYIVELSVMVDAANKVVDKVARRVDPSKDNK